MYLSVIIPAYNEADRIVRTIDQTVAYLRNQHFGSEIIVVSDGSIDDTRSVVENWPQSVGGVSLRILEYHPNRGKGYAVRYGMLRGKGDILMFMDADYAVPIELVESGLTLIRNGSDIAIGSRAVPGSEVTAHQNLFRELSAKLYTWIQNRYLGISYKDTQCGFKLFKADAAKTLFQAQKLDSAIFDPEILYLAKRHGMSVTEFPVQWHHVEDSRIVYDSLGKMLFIWKELFRIRKIQSLSE